MGNPRPLAWLGRRIVLGRQAPNDLEGFYTWLGASTVALPGGEHLSVGVNTVETEYGPTISFSCGICHSQNFFGTLVFGMGSKAPRANDLFARAKTFMQDTPMILLRPGDTDEAALIRRAQEALHYVGARTPQALGLDTSLAQMSLSLARRAPDGAAAMLPPYAQAPRPQVLDTLRADSKPADWYPVKYKDKFGSDGGIRGDVIMSVVLWNEVGRGTDMRDLDAWIKANPRIIADLGKLVRSAVPPRIGDFVPDAIDAAAAKRGEPLYVANCSSCHGMNDKNWAKGTQTVQVRYPKPTRVYDVDTDPGRATGMAALAPQMNALDISRKYGMVLKATGGYVAPPLDGIWSRYPYLHNRSVPNLCELLKPARERIAAYYVGTTTNVATDFDSACVGYPTVNVPWSWRTPDRIFDTRLEGLSNGGHEIFVGASAKDKRDLIEYLKTL
jgi:mono/diheme cytochrome c family protein